MSSNGGGGSNLLDMGLMIAAGVAAPELAPVLMEGGGAGLALGETAATAATGAGLSGLAAAATGQNVLRSAALGGIGGALSGALAPAGSATSDQIAQASQALNNPEAGSLVQGSITPAQMQAGVNSGLYTSEQQAAYNAALNSAGATPSALAASTPVTTKQMFAAAAPATLGALSKPPAGAYTPPNAIYTGGPLQKFKYDPNNYQPDIVKPPTPLYQAQYAEGGITSLAAGGNPGQFDNPLPNPQGYKLESTGRYDAIPSASDSSYFDSFPEIIAQALKESPANSLTMNVRPAYAAGGMASGGISTLGSYSDGGRLLKGPGDGMSDSIPAMIGKKQKARLADGEFVVPADVVSGLGNGSTDAGAKHLYKMMDKVRHARTGRKSQAKQIKADKYVPA